VSLQIFPDLKGVTYPTNKGLRHSTIVNESVSGAEVRIPNWSQARYTWKLPYRYLPGYYYNLAIANNVHAAQWPNDSSDYQTLQGFYELMLGKYQPFLFFDPTDYTTSPSGSPNPSIIGIGNGVNQDFQLARTMGGASHRIYAVNSTLPFGAPVIYLNSTPQGGGYTINSTGLVHFSSPPGNGVLVKADFCYYFVVRFMEDENEWMNEACPFFTAREIALYEVVNGV